MRTSTVILIAILASGCTTWRTMETPDPREAVARIGVNDTVKIVTRDGSRYKFRVASVKKDALIGTDNERIPIDDIHIIKVKHFDAAGTGLLVLGPPLLIVGAMVISLWCCFTL